MRGARERERGADAALEERALVALDPPSRGVRVNVVGDTHGQLHDFLKLLDLAGAPSETNWFVFNGDFVDRGAWGVELFALALASPGRGLYTKTVSTSPYFPNSALSFSSPPSSATSDGGRFPT